MNRQMKFRAWDTKQNKMYNDKCIESISFLTGEITFKFDIDILNRQNTERFILMEFTGLRDKNNLDIYEGDIVRCGDYIEDAHAFNYWVRKIIYDAPCFIGIDGEQNEVIGNIYENPELIIKNKL